MKVNYFTYLSLNWLLIFGSLWLTKMNIYFAPIAFLVIANRQFANYLVGHDGLHGLIVKNPTLNSFITRVCCLSPVYVSFLSYLEKHTLHHEFLGTPVDPDRSLYDFYPVKKGEYLKNLILYFFSFRMLRDFTNYFVPFSEMNKKNFYRKEKIIDLINYLVISAAFTYGFITIFGLKFFLFLWIGPLLVLMPYFYYVSAVQHGIILDEEGRDASRNIDGHWLAMEILLPCACNFHGVHHIYDRVPFYELRKVFVEKNFKATTFTAAFKELVR